MDGDWVQLLTRHSTDYHPRGPDKFLWNGTVLYDLAKFTLETVGSQLLFSEQQLSKYSRMITVIRSGLVVSWVHNLVKDDIKSIYRKMRAPVNWELLKWISFPVLPKSGSMSHSPFFMPGWRESESYLPKLHPQIPLTKWNDLGG